MQGFTGWVVLVSRTRTRQDLPSRRRAQTRWCQLSPPRRLAMRGGRVPYLATGFKFKRALRFRVSRIGAPLSQRQGGPKLSPSQHPADHGP